MEVYGMKTGSCIMFSCGVNNGDTILMSGYSSSTIVRPGLRRMCTIGKVLRAGARVR